jgi:hypothetical protein
MADQGPKNMPSKKTPALPRDAQLKIGERLKALYNDVVNQPVPDRFKDLLAQLDKSSAMNTASPPEGVAE